MAEKIPGWLERILLPQISELKGEVKATNARMDGEFKAVHSEFKRLDQRIDGVEQRIDGVGQKIDGLDQSIGQRIEGVDQRLSQKIEGLEKRMDVVQRLTVVEGKVRELESRR